MLRRAALPAALLAAAAAAFAAPAAADETNPGLLPMGEREAEDCLRELPFRPESIIISATCRMA